MKVSNMKVSNNALSLAKLILEQDFEIYKGIVKLEDNEIKEKGEKYLKKYFDEYEIEHLSEYADDTYIIEIIGRYFKRMYYVDWSGEDDENEIYNALTDMLKVKGEEIFNWDVEVFNENIDFDSLKRGDYVIYLFEALDSKLSEMGYRILFLNFLDDAYHFCVIEANTVGEAKKFKTDNCIPFVLGKKEVIIINNNKKSIELMKYLRELKGISLVEAKQLVEEDEINIGKYDINKADELINLVNKLGYEVK